jgi:histidine kinase/DNA gyrase B/HSP90-like ATPase
VRRESWRLRLVRWLAPAEAATAPEAPAPAPPAEAPVPEAWADVCEQFAWRLLVLTEQLRPVLDGLESGENDPDRLSRLYQLDHGVTRTRRVARDLRVLVGRGGEEIAEHTTSLLDVIRMAASAIEHYGRVSIGPVAELAVVAYAADDVASVLAALTDNATRYSPTHVTVSAHLLADGGVMLRVEDTGMGIDPRWLAALNSVLDGPVPEAGVINGRHTGFTVVHRLARRHGLRVQLASRHQPGHGGVSGTIAMVVVPAPLLCEIPEELPASGQAGTGQAGTGQAGLAALAALAQPVGAAPAPARGPQAPAPPGPAGPPVPVVPRQPGTANENPEALPRREPRSVRTPPRRAQPPPEAAPDPVAEGFAFADDLQAFSAALSTGQRAGNDEDTPRRGNGEGHRT